MNVYIDLIRIGFLIAVNLAYFALNMNVYIRKYENSFKKISYLFYSYVVWTLIRHGRLWEAT